MIEKKQVALNKWKTCKSYAREAMKDNKEIKGWIVAQVAMLVYAELKKYETKISGSEMIASSNLLADQIAEEIFK